MGAESPKRGNHQVESTQGATGANYSSDQVLSSLESPVGVNGGGQPARGADTSWETINKPPRS